MVGIIIAILLGIIAYFIATACGLSHLLAMLIGIAVGLVWYFGSNRPV